MTTIKPSTRTIGFDARVRILNTRGDCVRTIPVDGLSAQVPSGQASAQVDGALYADGLEVPFSVALPTLRGRPVVDIDYRPRGQIVKQVSRATVIGGSGQVVKKVTATAIDPVPRSMEVWVQGREQFWTTLSRR